MSLAEELKEKAKRKVVRFNVKVDEELSNKIEKICTTFDISRDEYLGKIIERSELNKVYNEIIKEEKNKLKAMQNNNIDNKDLNKDITHEN